MKDITNPVAIHTRLYTADAVKLQRLLLSNVNQQVGQAMRFKSGNVDEQKGAIQFGMGEFFHEGEAYLVESFILEDRRVQLKVHSSTAVAVACFDALMAVLADQGMFNGEAPLITTDQSSMVATLDFTFSELFAPAMSTLASAVKSATTSQGATPIVVEPRSFALDIMFEQSSEDIARYVVREFRKFTLEPRATTPLEDRRYFCAGPVDSETMQKVVGELEAAVLAGRRKR